MLTDLPDEIKYHISIYIYNISLQRETSIIYMLNNLEKNQEYPYIPFENSPIS